MIKITNVNKTFQVNNKAVTALQNINLEINAGEIFGIIGNSGAGKSTLLRCINLLERPTTGNVAIDNQELTTLTTKAIRNVRQKIGMIFQHFNLMPSRTALDNVMFASKNASMSKAAKLKKATELLELVGLSHRINAYPANLSGGEKQRVAIARALINDPKILLCDEATSALDPKTTASILKLLKDVAKQLKITIVLITHSMAVVKEICDRVAVVDGGQIKECGDVLAVFSNPQSEIAKQFVASTSGIKKIYELIEQQATIVNVAKNELLLKLTYSGLATKEPLIYNLSNLFEVKTNIIFGNIDITQGVTIGSLVINCGGNPAKIATAIEYLQSQSVQVEVLKAG